MGKTMHITRRYTSNTLPVREQIKWKKVDVLIKEKGRTILDIKGLEVPAHWSQSASEILAHKYLRKAGVPSSTTFDTTREFPDLPPEFLPSRPAAGTTYATETSAHQVFHRMAGHWAYAGLIAEYFTDRDDAHAFYDEVYYMLANQIAAPNSPQWFNTGLWWAYGIEGKGTSYRRNDFGGVETVMDIYENPQTSACFILGLQDSLLGQNGILDTVSREAQIFKYGSGSGVNYSQLRAKGSPLSNGGSSSGLMSFLKLFDANAGVIKSGGTTRRAARMVIVNNDHPEAEDFVQWKSKEELKVQAMNAGASLMIGVGSGSSEVLQTIAKPDYEGEAYNTVSGQNANNSLRVTDAFMNSLDTPTAKNSDGDRAVDIRRNNNLWEKLTVAAHACGDPGLQFHDTINKWHTIPKVAPQNATNPCAEYAFIDNSSCNLASLNLAKFWSAEVPEDTARPGMFFDDKAFKHACRLWTMVLDISVGMSSYPDKLVAQNSADYRAIGLGYANLGGLLMSMGIAYDSEAGRATASIITAIMHGTAYSTSAELADEVGAFLDFEKHASDVARVFSMHRMAAVSLAAGSFAEHVRATKGHPLQDALSAVEFLWNTDDSATVDYRKPIRNAQLSLLAPTGTIGLVMDCATTGIEPDFSLTKFKRLAGGGSMTLANDLVGPALEYLGYTDSETKEILDYVQTNGKVDLVCPHIKREHISVFDCAGDISWKGHIDMMAAVQPFLSGAISKTVNMPNSATVSEVSEAFHYSWKNGLKAVAIYRDGCKLSQPLTAVRTDSSANQLAKAPDALPVGSSLSDAATATAAPRTVPGVKKLSARYKLPSRRKGFTQKAVISGQTLYIRTGEYADGQLGEVFMNFGRDGSTMRHLLDSLAVVISLGLQHGVPLQEYVDAFSDTKSDPAGMVNGSANVRFCSSIMDYVVKELAAEYLHKEGDIPAHIEDAPPKAVSIDAPMISGTLVATNTKVSRPMPIHLVEDTNKVVPLNDQVLVLQQPDGESSDDWSEELKDLEEAGDVLPKIVRDAQAERSQAGTNPEPIPGLRLMSRPKYIGDPCPNCDEVTLRRSGTCLICDSCGNSTGCS